MTTILIFAGGLALSVANTIEKGASLGVINLVSAGILLAAIRGIDWIFGK